jgi:hypothetical protein
MPLTLTSSAFAHEGRISRRYTCEGEDTVPPLGWSGAPPGTASFALIVHDPDAPDPAKPQRDYVHWVLYDIPPTVTGLAEGAMLGDLPAGTRAGTNDFGTAEYGGPCPPVGRHRYFFELYALDVMLGDRGTPARGDVERAITGHVLEEAVLMGTYQKGDD